jgi:hypothetical protein
MLNNDAISELKPFNQERNINQLPPQAAQRVNIIISATEYICNLENVYTVEKVKEVHTNPLIESIKAQASDIESVRQSVYGAYEAA